MNATLPVPDGIALAVARSVLARGPLVLCYHGVGISDRVEDPEWLRVHPQRFREQLELLRAAGARFTTVAGVAAEVRDGARPSHLVAVSFDDGYSDNHEIALPILQELGIPGTVFITTGLIGRPNPWMHPDSDLRMMVPEELRELLAAGVELGAHTITHPNLATLDLDACRAEIAGSKAALEDLLGIDVQTFAYPYFQYGPAARTAVAEAGFAAAVTGLGQGGFGDPLALPRALVGGKDGMASFLLRVAGHYDPWFQSRLGQAMRATTRPARAIVRRVLDGVRR